MVVVNYLLYSHLYTGLKTVFLKPNPVGFIGFSCVFGQAGKIGKIIQKLSNLKP